MHTLTGQACFTAIPHGASLTIKADASGRNARLAVPVALAGLALASLVALVTFSTHFTVQPFTDQEMYT